IGENNRLEGRVAGVADGVCDVLVDEVRLQATAIGDLRADMRTILSIRPERVLVEPKEGACANLFDGRIEELIYHGDHLRVRLAALGRDDLIVKVPNQSGQVALRPGQAVRIGWRPEDCLALDGSA